MPRGTYQIPNERSADATYPGLAQYYQAAKFPLEQQGLAADAYSKMAYAKYAPVQPLAQLLSNPMVWSTLPADQLHNLTSMLTQALNGANQGGFNPASIRANQPTQQGGEQSAPFWNMPTGEQASSGYGGAPSSNNIEMPDLPAPRGMPSGTGGLPNTPGNILAGQKTAPGAIGGVNPWAAAKAQENAFNAKVQGEAQSDVTSWADQLKLDKTRSDDATKRLNILDNLSQALEGTNPFQQGILLGKTPALSGGAQEAEKYRTQALAAFEGTNPSNASREKYEALVPSRETTPEAREHLINSLRVPEYINQQEQQFHQQIRKDFSWLTKEQADVIFSDFTQNYKFFDPKSGKLLKDNFQKWKGYLNSKKINETLNKAYKEPEERNLIFENGVLREEQ